MEVLDLQNRLRASVIKVPDLAFCYFLNMSSQQSSGQIKHESLANQFRGPAPHFRSAAKHNEHGWFIESLFGSFWSCFACPMTEEQALMCRFRWMFDAFFSANRKDGRAKSRRAVHSGRSAGLIISNDTVKAFVSQHSKIVSSTCGDHKSNGAGSKSAVKNGKDECALIGCCCSHGIMTKAAFISKMGERFEHGALLLEQLVQEKPYLSNGVLSYDLMCNFEDHLEVFIPSHLCSRNIILILPNRLQLMYSHLCTHMHTSMHVL
jgi:hypothetical protein